MPSETPSVRGLETPCLLVDRERLEANITAMAAACEGAGVSLRPHVKSHKCLEIAGLQRSAGAVGLTCAKVSEAAVFARGGFDDLRVAYPVLGAKARELRRLHDETGARLSTVVDSPRGLEDLDAAWEGAPSPLRVLVKIDCGLGRVGVPIDRAEEAVDLGRHVDRAPHLELGGILTHAGHAYGADGPAEVAAIARREGGEMAALAREMRGAGLPVPEVSVGSTPTARRAIEQAGVTEVRPGVYVFCDLQQVALGAADWGDCALHVLATVVSVRDGRAVCDAGSKTLSSDRGAHGSGQGDPGRIVGADGLPDPELRLWRLSEEHGWILADGDRELRVGDRVRIVPAHACAAVNLACRLHLCEGERVLESWPVAARGRVA